MTAEAMELHFSATTILRLWTGDWDLRWNPPGETASPALLWHGAKVLGIGALDAPSVEEARRGQVTIAVNTTDDIKRFIPDAPASIDPGPMKMVVRLLRATETAAADGEVTVAWSQDLSFTGRASNARMTGGTIDVDIASATQGLSEAVPLYYSDGDQQAKYPTPSPDRGMEYARELAASDFIAKWPNRQ